MVDFQINQNNPHSLEIIFSKAPRKLLPPQKIKLSEDFEWDFQADTMDAVFENIVNLDGTVSRVFAKAGEFSWDIDLSLYPHVSNRFKCLISRFCKSRILEEVLYPFQKTGKKWLLESPTRILADDMGLGKSIQSIAAIEEGVFRNIIGKVLLVAPGTLVTNWEFEFRKWSPLLSTYSITSENINNKISIINKIKNHNVIITTYSSLGKIQKVFDEKSIEIDLIIADEAHKLRNTTSNLNRIFRSLARNKTWLLTGTPLERDEDDIKNILACLDPMAASAFDNRGVDVIYKSKLKNVSLRRLKRDVLNDLPAVQKITETLEMIPSQNVHYNGVLKSMLQAPSNERIGFLTKLSISAIVADDGSSCKFDRSIEICQIAKETKRKVVIFSSFNDPLQMLKKKLLHQNIDAGLLTGQLEKRARDLQISNFKSSKNMTCLLCNSRIASEGLNLTEASIVIFLNEWWNPSSNRQAEDRVNRIGQKDVVQIYVLRSNNTIDDNLVRILEDKVGLEKEFLDRLVAELTEGVTKQF